MAPRDALVAGVTTDRLDAAIDRLPRAELLAFVAALERARGATVTTLGPDRLRVDRAGRERVVRVVASGGPGRVRWIVRRTLGDPLRDRLATAAERDTGSQAAAGDVDVDVLVVTGAVGGRPARPLDRDAHGGRTPVRRDVVDLRERLLYAIDRDQATRVAATHLDVDLTAGVDDDRGRAGDAPPAGRATIGRKSLRSPGRVGPTLVAVVVVCAVATGAAVGPLQTPASLTPDAPGPGDRSAGPTGTEQGTDAPDRGGDAASADGSGLGASGGRNGTPPPAPPPGDSTLSVLGDEAGGVGRVEAADRTPAQYPPGVTAAGVVDPTALAAAHHRALRRGAHAVTFEGRGIAPATVAGPGAPTGAPTGNASGRWASAAGRIVAHNASAYRTSVVATWVPRRRTGQVSLDYEAYAVDGVEYRREKVGRGIGWVRYGNRSLSPSPTDETDPWSPTGWTAEWVEAGLAGTDLTVTPAQTDDGRVHLLLEGSRAERAPWIGTYTVQVEAVVTPTGAVRRFAVTRRVDDDDPVVTRRFRVVDAPTGRTIPDWRTVPRDPWGGATAANGTGP
jgi:hypothetical protein